MRFSAIRSSMDYKELDTGVLNQMLLHHIRDLEQEGLVDGYFKQCHSLKEDSGLSFFLDLIKMFLDSVRADVNEMAKALYVFTISIK